MKKFLFISHITPESRRSVLRQHLFDVMKKSLYQQTYGNWKALWISEKESQNDKIKEVAVLNNQDLSEIYLRKDVIDYIDDCDYIIKLDDDDVILSKTLETAASLDFDCYCDAYHTFFDITSGIITQQKRHWIAATCVHKKEHAMMHQNGKSKSENFLDSVFYGEHGQDWIKYYRDKKIIYADKTNPLYIRVLSPTSITSGAKLFPLKSIDDIDMKRYYQYLKSFGVWKKHHVKDFLLFQNDLQVAWVNFSGKQQKNIKGISMIDKIKANMKSFISKQ